MTTDQKLRHLIECFVLQNQNNEVAILSAFAAALALDEQIILNQRIGLQPVYVRRLAKFVMEFMETEMKEALKTPFVTPSSN